MRTPWIILTALAAAGAALAQTQPRPAVPGDDDSKTPARKATVSKPHEPPRPRTGPGQAGNGAVPGGAAKGAPAGAQQPAK
jgi:hypothetical protein